MLGAIIGDIAGSRFEWRNIKSKDFALFTQDCRMTDDSVMTLAIAQALADCGADPAGAEEAAVRRMQEFGRAWPKAGYGMRFFNWIFSEEPRPYNSYGNGAAMRVSPCAWAADSLEKALELARRVTAVTHDHPEGIKGAEATAAALWLARQGAGKEEIRAHIKAHYYPLDFTLDSIRAAYRFDMTCQGSVPQALEAFLEAEDFEDAVRNAISIGGDSDTIAAIAGSVAEAAFGIPDAIKAQALPFMEPRQIAVLEDFARAFPAAGTLPA